MDNNTADTDAAINVLVKRFTDFVAWVCCGVSSGGWLSLA
jgi:hypothetical protein